MAALPTSRDVARLAGVAQSTVSHVLTGKAAVSEATRQKVFDAMAELHYRPNAGARTLKTRKSQVIGLLFPVHVHGRQANQMRFLSFIASACRNQGYDTLIVTADEGSQGLRRVAGTALADGLLVLEVKEGDDLAATARALPVPTLFVGVPSEPATVVCIAKDYGLAGELCLEKLAKAGHRQAVVFTLADPYTSALNYQARFLRGVRQKAAELGVAVSEQAVTHTFLDLHRAVEHQVNQLGPAGAVITSPVVDAGDVASSLVLLGVPLGQSFSLVALLGEGTAPVGDFTLSGAELSDPDLAREAVGTLIGMMSGTGTTAVPGYTELIAPRWREGTTLRSVLPG